MKTIIILLLYLSSFSALSKKFVIGLSDTEHGLFKKADIKKVIQCTLGPEYDQISFLKLPYIRGVHLLNDTKINALYPVRSGDLEGLFPLYIDEVFIISKNSINLKNHINVGIIKESHSTTLKKYNNLNPTYTVNSINSLFTGLKAGRVKSIIVKRSQIPKNFSLDKYEIKSLKYEISGIALSKKDFSQKSLVEIKKNFSNCLSSMKFTLITNRKEVIYKSLLPDIKKIIKATGVIKNSKLDKNKAIKQWHSDSSNKIKEQLKKR
ncbi:MAG: hypothetical protein GY909_17765 [Oligoflexia bacterium]|nr:hypothetical protein [Oligoflexia bacterium]